MPLQPPKTSARKAFFALVALAFAGLSTNALGQTPFRIDLSPRSNLINPSLAGMRNVRKATIAYSCQGYGGEAFADYYFAGGGYNSSLGGGIEGYVLGNRDGLWNRLEVAVQISRFFQLGRRWSLAMGMASEYRRIALSGRPLFESQLVSHTFEPFPPPVRSLGLSAGAALFDEDNVVGIAVRHIATSLQNESGGAREKALEITASYGATIDIGRHRGQRQKRYLRPHAVISLNNGDLTYSLGAYYGRRREQAGLFVVGMGGAAVLGIAPTAWIRRGNIDIHFSFRVFPNLPSRYQIGNELIINYFTDYEKPLPQEAR